MSSTSTASTMNSLVTLLLSITALSLPSVATSGAGPRDALTRLPLMSRPAGAGKHPRYHPLPGQAVMTDDTATCPERPEGIDERSVCGAQFEDMA